MPNESHIWPSAFPANRERGLNPRLHRAETYAKRSYDILKRVKTMHLRKIVTGLLIASTLTLSAPVLAAPTPDYAGLEGSGGGFVGEGGSDHLLAILLALSAATLAVIGIIDSSKSP